MPAPGKTKLIKFPPSRAGKDVKCPGYARRGMFKLRFDRYIKFIENQSEHLSKLTLYHLKKRVLQGNLDVLVNRAEFHCYFLEASTTRIAC